MDGQRYKGVSDDVLEREIEAALGVDPSPEFVARVRERVANERVSEPWLGSWQWVGATVVITMFAGATMWVLRSPVADPAGTQVSAPRESFVPSRTRDVAKKPDTPLPDPESRFPVPGSRIPSPGSRVPDPGALVAARAERAVASSAAPEVVIAQDESAALLHLFSAISNGRFETRALPDLVSALRPPVPIEEIVLEPITIIPLAPIESE
jgi:hypothetical protein